jgi:hypothetical protein
MPKPGRSHPPEPSPVPAGWEVRLASPGGTLTVTAARVHRDVTGGYALYGEEGEKVFDAPPGAVVYVRRMGPESGLSIKGAPFVAAAPGKP